MKKMEGIEAYPLAWPVGWTRTEAVKRKNSRYEVPFGAALEELLHSLQLLGATEYVISTNVSELRRDGLPYSDFREPRDPGVAVYWVRKGQPQVMACDYWKTVYENLRAIGLALEAMRALERSGASQIMERAFTGFAALPAQAGRRSWRDVFGIENGGRVTRDYIDQQYRALAKTCHPDVAGGSHEAMSELNRARDEAYKELRL